MERRTSLAASLVARHPVAADWLLTGVVTVAALAQASAHPQRGATPVRLTVLGAVLAVAGSVPVAWRRRSPLGVLVLTELAVLLQLLLESDNVREGAGAGAGGSPGLIVALYTVATSCERRVSARVTATVMLVNAAVLLVRPLFTDAGREPDIVLVMLLLGGSWLVGDSMRTRRAYTAELEQRAMRLEREREDKALRAVAEERARISRELHDVVAHHVSVIAVQAGAAWEEATTDPAREALGLIQRTSRQVLAELRSMLDVPRADGVGPTLAPQPSLLEVDRLVAQSQSAGLPVELVIAGEPRPLPALLGLAAYRIVQESLTNTLRHAGPAHARVEVRYGDDLLELEVTDDGRATTGQTDNGSGGRGLIGMRERVALLGGELEVGPRPGGGFRVAAAIPINGAP
jgi:signal transduction histidine kinase